MSLPDDKVEGLKVSRFEKEAILVPFKENVTLTCENPGRKLRGTASSGFRQCVYDPKPVSINVYVLYLHNYKYKFKIIFRVSLIIGYPA